MNKLQKMFFVGIGGIGISALARVYHGLGAAVLGSDLADSEITRALSSEGFLIFTDHSTENLPKDIDLLVYSNAVPADNPERQQAKLLGIPELSYPQALGELGLEFQTVIAVSGTNGKTTTTAMIAWILEQAGFNPTVIVGSEVLAWGQNARVGGREYLVLEADEYCRAFLNYSADVAVITNIAPDHLDYFRDLEDIQSAFGEFIGKIKEKGTLVYDSQDLTSQAVVSRFIGSSNKTNIIVRPAQADEVIPLQVPGRFNQKNAAMAAAACKTLGVPQDAILQALQSFTGTWRRFERVGEYAGSVIISDYAHHPDGIKVTLEMIAEEFAQKKILVVFQPHQHNRTKKLFSDFVSAFCASKIENFIFSEIFDVAGREELQDQDVSSQDLVNQVRNCGKKIEYVRDLIACEALIRKVAKNFDMIVIMGAGDIYQVANHLVKS